MDAGFVIFQIHGYPQSYPQIMIACAGSGVPRLAGETSPSVFESLPMRYPMAL
jgi:hypothetical protein